MSDSNENKTANKPSKHFLPGFVFALAGLLLHPLFFIGALVCLVAVQTSRRHKLVAALLSSVLVIAAFGYTIGKDLAVRDNARDAKSEQSTAP